MRPLPGFEDILSFMGGMREERLAVCAFAAAIAGDSLEEAVERVEGVVLALGEVPSAKKGKRMTGPEKRMYDIAMRTRAIAETALHDLKQVRDHERKTEGGGDVAQVQKA